MALPTALCPAGGRGAAQGLDALLQAVGIRPPLLPGTPGQLSVASAWPLQQSSRSRAAPELGKGNGQLGQRLPAGWSAAAPAMRPSPCAAPGCHLMWPQIHCPSTPPAPPSACWPRWQPVRLCKLASSRTCCPASLCHCCSAGHAGHAAAGAAPGPACLRSHGPAGAEGCAGAGGALCCAVRAVRCGAVRCGAVRWLELARAELCAGAVGALCCAVCGAL